MKLGKSRSGGLISRIVSEQAERHIPKHVDVERLLVQNNAHIKLNVSWTFFVSSRVFVLMNLII